MTQCSDLAGSRKDTCKKIIETTEQVVEHSGLEIQDRQGTTKEVQCAQDINQGYCHRVAERVANQKRELVAKETNSRVYMKHPDLPKRNHVWVQDREGIKYDSECPTGTKSLEELPIFVREKHLQQTGEYEEDLDQIDIETSCSKATQQQ